MRRRMGVRRIMVVATCAFVCVPGGFGCSGFASVYIVPLDARRISETEPLVVQVRPQACYYWIDGDDRLCIAMREVRSMLRDKYHRSELTLAIVLDGPPAGSARDYRVGRDTARLRRRHGLSHTRARSRRGVVGVWDYGGRVLRGRFRFHADQQAFFVVSGWTGRRVVLCVGEFTAVHDRAAGEAILDAVAEGADATARRPGDPILIDTSSAEPVPVDPAPGPEGAP